MSVDMSCNSIFGRLSSVNLLGVEGVDFWDAQVTRELRATLIDDGSLLSSIVLEDFNLRHYLTSRFPLKWPFSHKLYY